jgi:DNA-binding response OmpR family regulator
MGALLLLTPDPRCTPHDALPALALLGHRVTVAPMDAGALLDIAPPDAMLVDARRELVSARGVARLLRTTGTATPIIAIVTEGGLAAVSADWGCDDVVLADAGPAELEARLRLAIGKAVRTADAAGRSDGVTRAGDLVIDETTYAAKLKGRPLDLTFKEFELLKHLAQHPGRVFTRAQLLQEVWGYDYYGGTRTVDVHVRRLRAKLGTEHEGLIGTVRHVGYKFVAAPLSSLDQLESRGADQPLGRQLSHARVDLTSLVDVSGLEGSLRSA